jgi:hypothetical protein
MKSGTQEGAANTFIGFLQIDSSGRNTAMSF